MKMFKDTKAVSPVIGIMLMLVVTVILAAAVSSTSTGLMKSTEKAPTAVFDVKIATGLSGYGPMQYMTIKQVTGDAIQTKDLKIVTTNPKADGETKIREKLPGVTATYGGYGNPVGNVPYWNNMAAGDGTGFSTNNTAVHFGNYVFKPGVMMTAQDSEADWMGTPYEYATWNSTSGNYDPTPGNIAQMQDMFADWDSVSKGDFVNVKIIHMPSNKVIFASDVEVV